MIGKPFALLLSLDSAITLPVILRAAACVAQGTGKPSSSDTLLGESVGSGNIWAGYCPTPLSDAV